MYFLTIVGDVNYSTKCNMTRQRCRSLVTGDKETKKSMHMQCRIKVGELYEKLIAPSHFLPMRIFFACCYDSIFKFIQRNNEHRYVVMYV